MIDKNKNKEKRLFTLKECMSYLGIKNERTLTKVLNEYKIPFVELLSRKMIDKNDIDSFIDSQKKTVLI